MRGRTYAKMGRAILAQPGGVAFQILDAKARKLDLYPTNYEQATTASADTLEKLAEELDINRAELHQDRARVQRGDPARPFNPDRHQLDGKCTAGITPPKEQLRAGDRGAAVRGISRALRHDVHATAGSRSIRRRRRCSTLRAGRFRGCYAAGEMAGGLWVGNYASGSGMMAGATFGRIAGMHAALAALQA